MLESSGARLVGYGLLATLAVFAVCVAAVTLLWARRMAELRVADLKEAAAAERARDAERAKEIQRVADMVDAVQELASAQRASSALDARVVHALEERIPAALERNTEAMTKSSLSNEEARRTLENVVLRAVQRGSGQTPAQRRPLDRREPDDR